MAWTSGGAGGVYHLRHQSELFEGGSAGVHLTRGIYGGEDAVRLCRFLAPVAVHQKGEGAVVGPQGADGRRGDHGGHIAGFRTSVLLYLTLLRLVDFSYESAGCDADGCFVPERADFVAQVSGGADRHLRRTIHRAVFVED